MLLGSSAHVWAAGQLPGPGELLIAFGLLGVACIGLASKERGFGFIASVLSLAQVALHFGFGFMAAVAAHGPVVVDGHGLAHRHMMPPAAGGSAAGLIPALQNGLHAWTLGMAIGHGLATLASAACLAYGERVLWWLARLVMPRLTLPRQCPVAVPDRLDPHAEAHALLPARHGVVLARGVVRRGPPAWSAA